MKFSYKKEFKVAIIDYGITAMNVMKFIKDEENRVRAICDWPLCPWVCLLKKTTLPASWLVTSLNDEHTCPQTLDNKMVTSRRIANMFERLTIDRIERGPVDGVVGQTTWQTDEKTVGLPTYKELSTTSCFFRSIDILQQTYTAPFLLLGKHCDDLPHTFL